MPKFPTDMTKARVATEKSRARLERRKKAAAEREAKTAAALEEMGRAAARELGLEASEVTMIVCRRGRR